LYDGGAASQMSSMVDLLTWNLVKLLDSQMMLVLVTRVMMAMIMMMKMMQNLIKVYILNIQNFTFVLVGICRNNNDK